MQKAKQKSSMSPLSQESQPPTTTVRHPFSNLNLPAPKSIRANIKVNRAIAQSRPSGILFALANGKLYFEYLKIFSVPENHLPPQYIDRGGTHSEVARSVEKDTRMRFLHFGRNDNPSEQIIFNSQLN
jgi:hypothetical protein